MRSIAEFDEKNYAPEWDVVRREAARAVIINNGRIALVRSRAEGFYKFPGGGIEPGESAQDAVIRETQEETGLCIMPETLRELGMVRERRRSLYESGSVFEQLSYYYLAGVYAGQNEQRLTESEQKLDYVLEWADIAEACAVDEKIAASAQEYTFLRREAAVLRFLLDNAGR